MSTYLDYAGRSYDVLAFQRPLVSGQTLTTQVLADESTSGRIATGILKLSQKFVVEFLTERESIPYQEPRGTWFMLEARTGRFQTQLDVYSAFARALSYVKDTFTEDELTTDPDDEKFDTAELVNVAIWPGNLYMTVNVLSQAGTTREVILPIAITV